MERRAGAGLDVVVARTGQMPRRADIADHAEATITRKPPTPSPMPSEGWAVIVMTPASRSATPTTSPAMARNSRARLRLWRFLPRTARANFGSSAYSDCSICSSSRCSCSESGTTPPTGDARGTRTPKEYDRNALFGNPIANPYRMKLLAIDFFSADQGCRTDRTRPETGRRAVGRALSGAPLLPGPAKGELAGCLLRGGEPLDPYADQPDAGPLQPQGLVESPGGVIDDPGDIGGFAQGLRPRDRGEVGEPNLDGDGPPDLPRRPQPGSSAVGQP